MVTKRKPWTTEERHILKKYYGAESLTEVLARLPDRTAQAVYKQVQYLRERGWTFNRNINE